MESVNINTVWEKIETIIQRLTPVEWAMIGGGLLLLILVLSLISRNRRKSRLRKIAPAIVLESFQISPMGRDAFFKIKNNAEVATLTAVSIQGRRDIVFKNTFIGHELHRDKTYSILLEATAKDRIENNFTIVINYMDKIGNIYKQAFELNNKKAKTPKLVKEK